MAESLPDLVDPDQRVCLITHRRSRMQKGIDWKVVNDCLKFLGEGSCLLLAVLPLSAFLGVHRPAILRASTFQGPKFAQRSALAVQLLGKVSSVESLGCGSVRVSIAWNIGHSPARSAALGYIGFRGHYGAAGIGYPHRTTRPRMVMSTMSKRGLGWRTRESSIRRRLHM